MFRSGKNINDTYEEEMLRKHGAIGGYSLIRLLEQDIHSINQESNEKKAQNKKKTLQSISIDSIQKPKTLVNIYFKKM